MHIPPINTIVALIGQHDFYRVGYINPGKQRITQSKALQPRPAPKNQ